jgi:predicted phosphodiesterase
VADDFIRIISDVHYGERASRVGALGQLRPLADGPALLVLNGDTLDTRAGPDPERNRRCLAEVRDFFLSAGPEVSFITGNHDPDVSSRHFLDLAGGRVFITHGDVLFEAIVPWGRDAPALRGRIEAGVAALPPGNRALEDLLLVYRRAAAAVGQRHQAESDPLKYTLKTLGDSAWPPWRFLRVLRAWRELPGRAADLALRHRPKAGFFLAGHTHRPGVWKTRSGVVVVNTGSFCRPFGALAVDVAARRLSVRRIVLRGGEFHPGAEIAAFQLAD